MIRLGFVGSGFMASTWVEVARQSPHVTPFAVWGGSRSSDFASDHGLQLHEDFESFCHADDIDAVIVTSPEQFHCQQTCSLLESGKHVLVEKPMASSLVEAKLMASTASRLNLRLGVVSQNRYRFSSATAKSLIQSGKLGAIRFVSVTGEVERWWESGSDSSWKNDYSRLDLWASWASHACDLLAWLIEDEPDSIYALSRQEDKFPLNQSIGSTIQFKRGTISLIQLNHTRQVPKLRPTLFFEIVGEVGIIRFDTHGSLSYGADGKWEIFGSQLDQQQGNLSYLDRSVVYSPIRLKAYRDQLDDFAMAIVEGRSPEVGHTSGLVTQSILEAVLLSVRESRPISVIDGEIVLTKVKLQT